MNFVVDTLIEPGLRYTEEAVQIVRSSPVRYCYLWRDDETEPVCELEVHSFRQRFGAVLVSAEGIGGVETRPQFRRQGYMSKLLVQALARMARRVDVAFVSDGIEGVYEKFGFVTTLAEGRLVVQVRHVEQMAANGVSQAKGEIRSASSDDLPAIIRLYNTAHTRRPWTHERHAGWHRLIPQETWRPGSEALVLEANGAVVGYVILQGQSFGHNAPSVIVDEMAAQDAGVARRLLVEIARRCWQMRLSEFWVREPLDSLVGRVACRAGCTYGQTFPPSGGMMAAILNRSSLLETLEPELRL
jgi:ribosomal protein S18 acetylase RimI-like enzyme